MSRLIDADALKKSIIDAGQASRRYKLGEIWELDGAEIEEVIDAQPVIEERKTGSWITQEFGSWAECPHCHELYDIPIAHSNFCPNCGNYNGGEN